METSRAGRWDRAILLALMAAYAALFMAFYPPSIGIEDEVGYVNQALVWTRGSVTAEGAGFADLDGFIRVGGRHVPVRQAGRSLAVLPFLALGGFRAIFLSGLLLHLTTAAVAGAILSRLGRSPVWAALVLFHPTLAIYSRTVMADGGAGLGLLLAALAVTRTDRRNSGVLAGVAVGVAALMRYHAGVALPFVAASFLYPPARENPRREAGLCLLTGGLCGALIVVYNLLMYHHPTDPNPAMRGLWSARYVIPQAIFYVPALMTLWPAMLLAPVLDRSILRWLVRGVCGFYLTLFLFYYWHDAGSSWAETAVVGLRLIQVALPLWIVSYAVVLDDWVATPLRRAFGVRATGSVAAAACFALLAATGLMFAKHQAHLKGLLAAREAVSRVVPAGSVVVANGTVSKLFGVPTEPPSYRLRYSPPEPAPDPRPDAPPWYVVVLVKSPTDTSFIQRAVAGHRMSPLPSGYPNLFIYASESGR